MRRAHRQRGAVLIWVAVALIALIGFVGLALDMGYVVWVTGELQNAADAAALAGAQRVRHSETDARDAAVALAAANFAAGDSVALDRNDDNLAEGEVVIGRYDRDEGTFTSTLDSPNAVRVLVRRTPAAHGAVPLVFGPIFGHDTASISRYAIGMVGGGTGAGMISLDGDDRSALDVSGSATLNVNGGDIQINSNHPTEAVRIQGSVTIAAPNIDVGGDVKFVGNSYVYDGQVNTGAPSMSDPLASLEYPAVGEPMSPSGILDSGTFSPGYYPNGLNLNAGKNVVLEPGIYVLDNGLQIGGNATLTAHGVMFFIRTGAVRILGTGDVIVTPPTEGLYEGLSFFQARENTETAVITGTGFMDEAGDEGGALYFPSATVQLGGTGDLYINQLIANKVAVSGAGVKTIMYRGDVPAAGNRVFLVE